MLTPRQYAETVNRSHVTVMTWIETKLLPAEVHEVGEKTYYLIAEGTPAPELKRGRPPKVETKPAAKKAAKPKGN